jgi:pimeloyl-ACP methyl ester carboxylesterase
LHAARGAIVAAVALALVLAGSTAVAGAPGKKKHAAKKRGVTVVRHGRIARWTIHYRAHNGVRRAAYVLLPSQYGPRAPARLPLVISPHGRGIGARANSAVWGLLPAAGNFAVVSPEGQGRILGRYSWGSPGQIEDLARMPYVVHAALPWLHVNRRKVYAFGGSMGGQETLLLLARHPKMLAGAAAFDAVTDFGLQYKQFPLLGCSTNCKKRWDGPFGRSLQALAREEIGGSPGQYPGRWAKRSPWTYRKRIAASCVPLQLWWSPADKVVIDQGLQSGRFFWQLRQINPTAPIQAFVGFWIHSAEMRAKARLPLALATFGLLKPNEKTLATPGLHVVTPPTAACNPYG